LGRLRHQKARLFSTNFLPVLDLTSLPTYSKSFAINRVILRDLLLEPVKLGQNLHYGKLFSGYGIIRDASSGSEKVKVSFADGTSDECDTLIGTDGSSLRVNKTVGLNNLINIDSHWSFLPKGSQQRC
jgi:hypothetical protein